MSKNMRDRAATLGQVTATLGTSHRHARAGQSRGKVVLLILNPACYLVLGLLGPSKYAASSKGGIAYLNPSRAGGLVLGAYMVRASMQQVAREASRTWIQVAQGGVGT